MNSCLERNQKMIFAIAIILIVNIIAIATLIANAQTMNRQDVEAIIYRQAQAWENGDVEAVIADFAEDSLFIAARKQFRGKKAIKIAAEDYFQQFTDTKVQIKRIIIEDNSGAVEWDWSDKSRQTNVAAYAEDAIIFQLKNSKIVYWREYIDKIE